MVCRAVKQAYVPISYHNYDRNSDKTLPLINTLKNSGVSVWLLSTLILTICHHFGCRGKCKAQLLLFY